MNIGRRSRHLGTALLTLGIAGTLFAASQVSRVLFERPTPLPRTALRQLPAGLPAQAPPRPAPAATDDGRIFQVASADGDVSVFREGRWIPIQHGDVLTSADVVRTAAGARAVLRLTAGTEIELRERVEIGLDRLSAAGASVNLRRGKVVARVSVSSEALVITTRDTRTANDGPAHFVVMTDEHGQVSVAALEGTARFAAAGKTVLVREGNETRSRLGEPPDDPEKIPEEVLLQVIWPTAEKHGETAALEGRTTQAALVTVNGAPIPVAPDGRFAAVVPLREGANVVHVQAEDLAGRLREASTTLLRKPARPPRLAPEPAELWKKKGAP
jgi:hypothetical protein